MTDLEKVNNGQKTDEPDESQYNFIEHRNPAETAMCLILAAAYLGLAKYCLGPLLVTRNWGRLTNVERFFCYCCPSHFYRRATLL